LAAFYLDALFAARLIVISTIATVWNPEARKIQMLIVVLLGYDYNPQHKIKYPFHNEDGFMVHHKETTP
jgi:hypothetical protein